MVEFINALLYEEFYVLDGGDIYEVFSCAIVYA